MAFTTHVGFMIEKEVFEGDEKAITNYLGEQAIPYVLHPCDDFNPAIAAKIQAPQVFCYGSLQWIAQVQASGDTRLKTICSMDSFDCCNYYPAYGQYLFNKTFVTRCLRLFVDEFDRLLEQYGGQVFMRPSTGFKSGSISGGVFDRKTFDQYISFFQEALGDDDVLIVDAVKHIDYEWRAIVQRGDCVTNFITGCQYKSFDKGTQKLGFDPTPDFPQRVRAKVEEIIKSVHWVPDSMFVMDIVESNGELSLMELNALSTSGWYDCDAGAIIDAIVERYHK